MVSRPAIYRAEVEHVRNDRVHNAFTYSQDIWLVDLDDLPRLPAALRPFARFEARDHLGDPGGTIRGNVDGWLGRRGVDLAGGRILMLTSPRSLGHAFNPLSLFWCHHRDGHLAGVIAEVHNTYGERHCYLVRPDELGRATIPKQFYVSPFFSVTGEYLLRVPEPGPELRVSVVLRQGVATPVRAALRGRRRPLNWQSVLGCVLRHPLGSYRVSGLIRYQGIKLFLRRVPVVRRPAHVRQEGVQ